MGYQTIKLFLAFSAFIVVAGRHTASERQQRCGLKVLPCYGQLAIYASTGDDMAEVIARYTIEQHCQNLRGAMRCFMTALQSDACEGLLTSDQLEKMQNANELVDYLCVDKLPELIKYQACLKDAEVEMEHEHCSVATIASTCNVNDFTSCANRAIDGSAVCRKDARAVKRFIRDFLNKVVSYMPGCEELKDLFEIYKVLF